MRKGLWLLFFLGLCLGIAALGSWATYPSLDPWYFELKKASWNPPGWVFGPVWTVLYLMIAFAGWQIFLKKKSKQRQRALTFYFIQLALNCLWSFLFFYFHNPYLSMIDLLLLVVMIGLTLRAALPVSRPAALLLTPYFIWILYAATLNAAIVYYLLTSGS